MTKINPLEIQGRWKAGFALDIHVLSSTHVGVNEQGHDIFETTRSEVGELMYQLKYKHNQQAADTLVAAAIPFLKRWGPKVDVVVAIPPTKKRAVQPVFLLATGISKALGLPFLETAVTKTKDLPAAKDISGAEERANLLKDAYEVDVEQVVRKSILLVDDLYQTGASMNAVASALYDTGSATSVFALAMTKTRRYP